jgi:protein TonB
LTAIKCFRPASRDAHVIVAWAERHAPAAASGPATDLAVGDIGIRYLDLRFGGEPCAMEVRMSETTMDRVTRYGTAFPIAAGVTLFLFWLMPMLIATGIPALQETIKSAAINFVRMQRNETVQLKERKLPEKTENPMEPPPPLPATIDPGNAPAAVGLTAPTLAVTRDINLSRSALPAMTDAAPVPLVRIPPEYPAGAQMRGLEGWVQLEFTINESGSTEDIRVTAAEPPEVFDKAAVRALSRWRYKPMIAEGRPAKYYNAVVVITFDLDDIAGGPRR